jgi:hypothetical protein
MPFIRGQSYTREAIRVELGILVRTFLPHKDRLVVCGCFTLQKNPCAPREIFAGNSQDRMRWAAQFASQDYPIPIFIKERTGRWRYEGMWRVMETTRDRNVIGEANRHAHRNDIGMILRLVEG